MSSVLPIFKLNGSVTMTMDVLNLIKSSKIFSSLDEEALKLLLNKFDEIHLHKNDILFHQGELSNDLYFLVSGKLIVILKTEKNEQKILGEVAPGETVGEIGAISHEPRTATVKAFEDSILLKLSGEEFSKLCHKYPSVSSETINTLFERSRNSIELLSEKELPRKHIAIIPVNRKVKLKKFSKQLEKYIKEFDKNTVFLSDYDFELYVKYNNPDAIKELVSKNLKSNKMFIYILPLHQTPLSNICFENIDMVYLVGNSDTQPYISRYAKEVIKKVQIKYAEPELILLYEESDQLPQNTRAWLKLTNFGLHHHLRVNQTKDWQRMVRFIHGQSNGVVLSGGGIRCWAHLGAIKAILESEIPIDIIGGTSSGAICAGYYALYETYLDSQNKMENLSEATRTTVSFKNITWPAVSLFDGESYSEKQKLMYGKNVKIEDLWMPFFCVSTNLSNTSQAVHRTGYLWKKVRASTAVPGVFPPVIFHGKIHLDGGLLNNLPVDVMKKSVGKKGFVIAVELTHKHEDEKDYHFPLVMSFWKTIMAKMSFSNKEYTFPSFIDLFLKALLAGSSAKQAENCSLANILISPDLSGYRLLTITKQQEKELFEIGYRSAMIAIQKWREQS